MVNFEGLKSGVVLDGETEFGLRSSGEDLTSSALRYLSSAGARGQPSRVVPKLNRGLGVSHVILRLRSSQLNFPDFATRAV